jgi:hypothetical protein
VKLGQVLSTRSDMLPAGMIAELSGLQDDVPAAPAADIEALLAGELGAPVRQVFAWFDPEPLAAGSIAQAHRAQLGSGEQVVIKVQRPGVRALVERDLEIMLRLARTLEARAEWARRYRVVELVQGFADAVGEELDFRVEARNIAAVAPSSAIQIPAVHRSLSTSQVLVLDFLDGVNARPVDGGPGTQPHRIQIAPATLRVRSPGATSGQTGGYRDRLYGPVDGPDGAGSPIRHIRHCRRLAVRHIFCRPHLRGRPRADPRSRGIRRRVESAIPAIEGTRAFRSAPLCIPRHTSQRKPGHRLAIARHRSQCLRARRADILTAAWRYPSALARQRRRDPPDQAGLYRRPLSSGNTALLVDMAKATGLPWDVILGSDICRAYKPSPDAYRKPAALLGFDPGEVMLVAAHNSDLEGARRAGLATAFIARPAEYGPHQATDLTASDDWDLTAKPDSRSATTAPPSSAASTAACSAHLPAATRSRSARPPRRCQPEYRRGRQPRLPRPCHGWRAAPA